VSARPFCARQPDRETERQRQRDSEKARDRERARARERERETRAQVPNRGRESESRQPDSKEERERARERERERASERERERCEGGHTQEAHKRHTRGTPEQAQALLLLLSQHVNKHSLLIIHEEYPLSSRRPPSPSPSPLPPLLNARLLRRSRCSVGGSM